MLLTKSMKSSHSLDVSRSTSIFELDLVGAVDVGWVDVGLDVVAWIVSLLGCLGCYPRALSALWRVWGARPKKKKKKKKKKCPSSATEQAL
jgi:hypothetical protein